MPDTYSKEVRSRVMARVRSRDTGPEVALRQAMYALGLRGWRCHRRALPGTPDIAFGRARLAVFVDGAFWHGHPSRYKEGQSGAYWDEKIQRNRERDRRVDRELKRIGWTVLRLWDFEVLRDPVGTAVRVQHELRALEDLGDS